MQHDFQHRNNDDSIHHAQPGRERPCTQFRETGLEQVGENSPGAQPKQRDRDSEKREVVEEHDREDAGEASSSNSAAKLVRARPDNTVRSGISVRGEVGGAVGVMTAINGSEATV